MKSNKKTFAKHYVERNPMNLQLLEEKGKPVIGSFIRTTRILQGIADQLNANWKTSGVMWVEVKEKKEPKANVPKKEPSKESPKKELSEEDKEKEARKEKKAKLMKVAEQLVKDGKLPELPPKNIPLEKLEAKLNELKEN
jgi:hypothetical protein